MQVTLGRRGDYAVRALLDVVRHAGAGRRKTREIAADMDIPASYLPQILAGLVRGGYLTAQAGPAGGYSLARPAERITLLEVVEHAEGPTTVDRCILRGGACSWETVCPFHDPWARAQAAFTRVLQETTFADIATIDALITSGRYAPGMPPHRQRTPRRGRATPPDRAARA